MESVSKLAFRPLSRTAKKRRTRAEQELRKQPSNTTRPAHRTKPNKNCLKTWSQNDSKNRPRESLWRLLPPLGALLALLLVLSGPRSAPRAAQERPEATLNTFSRILGPRLACQTCVSIGTESAGICWASFCFCCRQLRARWNARSDERNAQLCKRQAQTRKNGKRSRLRTNCKNNKGREQML